MSTQLKVVSVERVSVGSDGEQGEGASIRGVFSADGATLLMQSGARFVPEDLNSYGDIYLKDFASGAVERVTLDPAIADPESGGYEPEISADGTRVAYTSTFDVTIDGRTGAQETVVFKDLLTGEDKLISASVVGEPGNDASFYAHFSPDGTQIAFTSYATNLVPCLTMVGDAVFLKDIASGDIRMLSSNAAVEAANNYSVGVGFTPDGSNFAFSSLADNLIEDDGNGVRDIFTKNLTTGAVRRLSVGADGTEGNGDSSEGSFSPDGSKLLFASRATNFVAGDRNGSQDLFIKDLVTGEITLASIDSLGNQWVADSYGGVFSPDGTKIAFYSDTAGLAVRDDNSAQDVFVKDLVSGAITVLSANVAGEIGDAQSFWPQFVPDGSGVLFTSYATNLVPDDTNGERDLFIARFQEQKLGGPVQWTEAEGGNGHWYQYVEEPLTWAEARADAESRSHLGLPGYLTTITSAEENAFILSLTPQNVWAGGTDERVEGVWEWVGGPEVGDVFWTRQDGTVTYADWGGYEPNNVWSEPPGEDYLLAHALYATGTWADAGVPPNPNGAFGYLVEYSDIEPSPAQIGLGRTEAETLDIEAGFVVRSNPHPSGDAYLQASGAGEQGAYGRFSGEAGLYTLTIGYFDETDGDSTMSAAINGEVIDQWEWDAGPAGAIVTKEAAMKRLITFVELEEGDIITLFGTADGREPLRTDFVDIREAPPLAGSFLVEAETLEITDDFQIFSNPHASGDAYLQAGGGRNQRALYDFNGLAGRYDLTVGYFDESDGVSEMNVLLNGVTMESWLWDGDFGDRIVTPAGAAQYTLKGIELVPGDQIELYGHPDGGERLRVDFLEFSPTTPPRASDLWFAEGLLDGTGQRLIFAVNDGTGRFTTINPGITWDTETVIVADVDGDGDDDVIEIDAPQSLEGAIPAPLPDVGDIPAEFDFTFRLHENIGSWNFVSAVSSTLRIQLPLHRHIVEDETYDLPADLIQLQDAADVDGDGDIDLLALSNISQSLLIFENDGTGQFQLLARSDASLDDHGDEALFGDFTEDEALDAVVATGGDYAGVWIMINDGTGQLSYGTAASPSDESTGSPQVVDLDSDGDLDVLYTAYGDGRGIFGLLNDGTGHRQPGEEPSVSPSGFPRRVGAAAAADFDGDGRVEMVTAALYGEGDLPRGLRLYEVVTTEEAAEFVEASYDPRFFGNVSAPADYDLDGDIDLVFYHSGPDGGLVSLLLNDGTGRFEDGGLII